MNKIKNYMAVAALLLAGFTSCAVEQDSASGQNASGKGTKVTIKINNGASATTRATAGSTGTLTGADRENQITNLYAVLYKDKNSSYAYYKTFACTHDTDSGHENEYTFDVEDEAAGGVYYMYLIANPTTALKAVLDADNSGNNIDTEEDLHSYVVTPVLGPATDITTVEDFVMTSPRTQIDMKGNAETVVDGGGTGIVLTRLAVRIDIDATALNITNADAAKSTTFEITKVTMNTRYTESDLMRGGSNGLSMGTLTTASNVEFSGFTAVTDYIETNNKYWKGAIYSCENYDTSNPTILTIEGVYKHGENQALNVSQQVVFRDVVRDGSGNITSQDVIPLQRNHLYKVVLTPKYNLGALEFEKIDYAIQVVDWQNGETIKFTGDANLTHQSTPSFTVRNAVSVSGTESDGVTNPTLIYTGVENGSIFLTVTSETTGTMLECPTFNSTKYGLVASETTNDANGNLVETYKIDIDDDVAIATDYTFKISNAINTTLYREFVLKRRPKLAIEYVAERNLASYNNSTHIGVFAVDNRSESSAYWSPNTTEVSAMKNGTKVEVNGYDSKFHLPTVYEWLCVAPQWDSRPFDGTGGNDEAKRIPFGTLSNFTWTEYAKIGNTAVGGSGKSYCPGAVNICYAIRFIGTTQECAYRYEMIENLADVNPGSGHWTLIVSVKYLGPNSGADFTGSDPSVKYVANDAFWNSGEVIKKILPACGYFNPTSSTSYPVGSFSTAQLPDLGSYMSATWQNYQGTYTNHPWYFDFRHKDFGTTYPYPGVGANTVDNRPGNPDHYAMPLRLFYDE